MFEYGLALTKIVVMASWVSRQDSQVFLGDRNSALSRGLLQKKHHQQSELSQL